MSQLKIGGLAMLKCERLAPLFNGQLLPASGGMYRLVDAVGAPLAIAAGADVLVAGTASFKGGPRKYADNIRRLRGSK